MTGRAISHYEVLEKLGEGGMGKALRVKYPDAWGYDSHGNFRHWRRAGPKRTFTAGWRGQAVDG